jgi:RNA polymerase sigma-70 factor (ECF subfamily)
MTDDELVAHIRASGDTAAFGELVRRYEVRIVTLLRRLTAGDRALADDLAQETFLAAFRHLARFRGDSTLATWLIRIAVRQYLTEVRKRRPEPVEELGEDEASHAAIDLDARIDLDRGLMRIRDEQRLALVLAHEHGMTHAEIAELTGWPLGTVKTHANRGRAALRAQLHGDDDDRR